MLRGMHPPSHIAARRDRIYNTTANAYWLLLAVAAIAALLIF